MVHLVGSGTSATGVHHYCPRHLFSYYKYFTSKPGTVSHYLAVVVRDVPILKRGLSLGLLASGKEQHLVVETKLVFISFVVEL